MLVRGLSPILLLFAVLALALPTGAASLRPAATTLLATATLPDIPLATAQNAVLPGTVADDRGFFLGGLNDLWRGPADPAGEYWTVTSQGPNGQLTPPGGGATRRTAPVPEFNPLILHVRVDGDQLQLVRTIPIVTPAGAPVSGLSNLAGSDAPLYSVDAATLLSYNPDGLAAGGLVRAASGEFWVAEEYRPSLVQIGADGRIIRRYIPAGVSLPASYPVAGTLPAILDRRTGYRGFDGLALTPDGTTLFVAMESPLSNPSRNVGGTSRSVRILAVDTATGQPTAEYVYRVEQQRAFDPAAPYNPVRPNDEMKVSGMIALDNTTLYVLERTDQVARIYRAGLTSATNILGSRWDDPATSPTLEELADTTAAGVAAIPKTLVANLEDSSAADIVEGIALADATTVAYINDNRFNITAAGTAERSPTRQRSQLRIILPPPPRTYLPLVGK